ncbi:betaine/proline/choline family ABC transporter ATP-binding protein [Atopococcus tabaci]|uniref:betaine/proline/choline family ABC transporter ATP-binding protein n=1 Tax=Atopococcus tabaci TaxID=269774 RepID=UPI0004234D62|nr:ABC transporter ATP-binding protein [Atopococcus tabaci]
MIEFDHVSKVYEDGTKAVDDVSLKINDGEFVVFIGTSGSGKTTTMRMINRMIEPTSGEIRIDGKDIMKQNAVQLRRRIGYVIQQTGLMPHMTVYENIVMVPRLLKWEESKIRQRAKELLERVDMPEEFLDRYPQELSGGQQQRIGVIRALAADQDIILMDEPFGALDPITRDALQELVKHLQEEMGKTVIFVTHDMDEALNLADKIAIMSHGKLLQYDTPDNILSNPANEFVESFIGEERLIQARPNIQTVDQVMIKDPVSVTPGVSLQTAIKLMRDKRVDALFVTDDAGILKGVVDFEDINHNRKRATSVSDIMTRKVYYVRTGSYLRDTVDRMLKRGFKNIPVVDEKDRLIGLVTRASLVNIVYDIIWGDEEEERQTTEAFGALTSETDE